VEFLRDLPRAPPFKKAAGIAILNALTESCLKRRPDQRYAYEFGKDALDTVPFRGMGTSLLSVHSYRL
jgi:hypothetical protein